jgi:hypothetical protein
LVDYSSSTWQENHRKTQIEGLQILRLDGFVPPVIYVKDLLDNLSRFSHLFSLSRESRVVGDEPGRLAAEFPSARLNSHVRAFVVVEAESLFIDLKNLTNSPLSDIRIQVIEDSVVAYREERGRDLPSYVSDSMEHVLGVAVRGKFSSRAVTEVAYRYRGEEFRVIAVIQQRGHKTGFSRDVDTHFSVHPGVTVDNSAKAIELSRGKLVLRESVELPRGWSFTLDAGTELVLEEGATLKLRGPLFSKGTATDPVQISITPDLSYRGMGAWGGVLVVQAERQSIVDYTQVYGAGEVNLANRQDYYGSTGCLTFYESDVTVNHSQISDSHCEDALNIVRARFVLEDVTISQSRADGFDSDFSSGSIRNSSFERIGNDAIDVSGTQLTLSDSFFREVGDKAISVGEQSNLTARKLLIEQASTGVASKDLSSAVIRESQFSNISGSGLITYVKKSEYGSATIECDACVFTQTNSISTNQIGSTIFVDGESQSITNFNQQQLVEAGYVGIE